jgi:hypothetical protein
MSRKRSRCGSNDHTSDSRAITATCPAAPQAPRCSFVVVQRAKRNAARGSSLSVRPNVGVVDLRHYRHAIFFVRLRGVVVQLVVDDSTIWDSIIVEEIH